MGCRRPAKEQDFVRQIPIYKPKAAGWATRCPMGAACQVISIADSWAPPPSFSTLFDPGPFNPWDGLHRP